MGQYLPSSEKVFMAAALGAAYQSKRKATAMRQRAVRPVTNGHSVFKFKNGHSAPDIAEAKLAASTMEAQAKMLQLALEEELAARDLLKEQLKMMQNSYGHLSDALEFEQLEHSTELAALSGKLEKTEAKLEELLKQNQALTARLEKANAEKAELEDVLSAQTVKILKEKLRELKLPVSGRKAELIERLLAASEILRQKLHVSNAQKAEMEEKLTTAEAEKERLLAEKQQADIQTVWMQADHEKEMEVANLEKEMLQSTLADLNASHEDMLLIHEEEKAALEAGQEALARELGKERRAVQALKEELLKVQKDLARRKGQANWSHQAPWARGKANKGASGDKGKASKPKGFDL